MLKGTVNVFSLQTQENQIQEKGRLGPGQMLAVDLDSKRILRNWDVKEESANSSYFKS